MPARVYDPGAVALIWNGLIITGFLDGTFIEASRNEEANSLKVGADGEFLRVKNRNKSGSVKFTLMQSALMNDFLSAALAVDEGTPLTGAGFPTTGSGGLILEDNSGRTQINAADAWLKGWTKVGFGKDAEGREWTIETGHLVMFAGGN